jgi:hypothetical protein
LQINTLLYRKAEADYIESMNAKHAMENGGHKGKLSDLRNEILKRRNDANQ